MASGTFYPAVIIDDGHWKPGYFASTFTSSITLGNYQGAFNIFCRFVNVTIPKGAVISNAFVRFVASADKSNTTVKSNIYFNDEDDAVAPTNETEANALSLTAFVAWGSLPPWTYGTTYDTPDFASVLQEIIDRAGWVSGNASMIVIKDDGSTAYATRAACSIGYLSGARKAELHVTWTIEEFIFTNPIPTHLSTVYGITTQLYLTTTISGPEPEYVYDADFYDNFDVQIGTTVSGINSGSQAASNAYLSTPSGIDYSWYMTASSSGVDDTSQIYTFHNRFLASGTTEINNVPASGISVRLYRRSTGEYIGGTTSAGVSGTFEIESSFNEYHYVVGLYDSDDTNAVIYDWIKPE